MNKHRNIRVKLVLCAVLFAGCQGEKMEESFPEPDKIITPGSQTAVLIERTVLHDGSYDNILDHASCISLKLPVTVRIKNETIQLNIIEDISALASHPDKDKIQVKFPATVVLADYSEVTVPDKDQLKNLIKECETDNDVECTDFQFPLTVYSYDRDKQLQATETVDNDRALLLLMKQLNGDDIMSFKFPFRMKPKGGNEVEIGNNLQLDDHVLSFDAGCDEADEVDELEEIDIDEFTEALVDEKWILSHFFNGDEEQDETSNFSGVEFDFKSNKTIDAKKSQNVFGSWDINESEGGRKDNDNEGHGATEKEYELEMVWENEYPFHMLDGKWDIISLTNKKITLSTDESLLIFEIKDN